MGGTTATAAIDGISAAGATPALRTHTPPADLEIVTYGRPVRAPVAPVSPSGCPTPAAITRAVLELTSVPTVAVDAGLDAPSAAPTVDLGAAPGGDVRDPAPVPGAGAIRESARSFAADLPDDDLVVGETIPAGTTTALGVLTALGERPTVSSSLPAAPTDRKRAVVETGLAASDLSRGDAAGAPTTAVGEMGDPVLAAVAGLIEGAADAGTTVTLAGGTQLAAAAALARHTGVDAPLTLATTSFLADDPDSDVRALADDLALELTVTDPAFDAVDHPAARAYCEGEAKEGVGAGGSLALARERGLDAVTVRGRFLTVADRLLDRPTEVEP